MPWNFAAQALPAVHLAAFPCATLLRPIACILFLFPCSLCWTLPPVLLPSRHHGSPQLGRQRGQHPSAAVAAAGQFTRAPAPAAEFPALPAAAACGPAAGAVRPFACRGGQRRRQPQRDRQRCRQPVRFLVPASVARWHSLSASPAAGYSLSHLWRAAAGTPHPQPQQAKQGGGAAAAVCRPPAERRLGGG